MPSEQELVGALRQADQAGDTEGAHRIADMIRTQRGSVSAPQDRAKAAGQAAGASENPLVAGAMSAADSALFGGGKYVSAAARYVGQHATGVQNPDDFSTDLAYAHGEESGRSDAHPIASTVGGLAGAVGSGGLLGSAVEHGTGLAAKLALKANAPMANLMRIVGSGAIAGGSYGAAHGAVANADQGAVPALRGAATEGAEGAVGGAVLAPVGAGAAKVIGAAKTALTGDASQKAIALFADKLGVTPARVQSLMDDFRTNTGHAPRLADIADAVTKANIEPIANAKQSSAAKMQNAATDATEALPGRMQGGIAAGGQTQTPFGPASQSTMRLGDAMTYQKVQMDQAMGNRADPSALANQRVTITPQDAQVLQSPQVQDALHNDRTFRAKLGTAAQNAATGAADSSLTVDDFDRLRHALRGAQQRATNVASPNHAPQMAQEYGAFADAVGQHVGQQYPDYGQALDAFHRQSDFIKGFSHADGGKSIYDAPDNSLIGTLDTPEGRAGLEIGARSKLFRDAGETESGALGTANKLRQGAPSKTLESLPTAEANALRLRGSAETTSQKNFSDLSQTSLQSKDAENAAGVQKAIEGTVATVGHTLTGYKAHTITRWLTQRGTSEKMANNIVDLLVKTRTPQDVAALTNALNRAKIGADSRRLILKQVSRYTGGAGGGIAAQLNQANQVQ